MGVGPNQSSNNINSQYNQLSQQYSQNPFGQTTATHAIQSTNNQSQEQLSGRKSFKSVNRASQQQIQQHQQSSQSHTNIQSTNDKSQQFQQYYSSTSTNINNSGLILGASSSIGIQGNGAGQSSSQQVNDQINRNDSNKNAGKSSRLPQNMNPKFNINKISLSPQKLNKGILSQSNVGQSSAVGGVGVVGSQLNRTMNPNKSSQIINRGSRNGGTISNSQHQTQDGSIQGVSSQHQQQFGHTQGISNLRNMMPLAVGQLHHQTQNFGSSNNISQSQSGLIHHQSSGLQQLPQNSHSSNQNNFQVGSSQNQQYSQQNYGGQQRKESYHNLNQQLHDKLKLKNNEGNQDGQQERVSSGLNLGGNVGSSNSFINNRINERLNENYIPLEGMAAIPSQSQMGQNGINSSPIHKNNQQYQFQQNQSSNHNKSKIEAKNRMLNQNLGNSGRANKNLTDAQKRIAKIIRDQHQINGQMGDSNTNANGNNYLRSGQQIQPIHDQQGIINDAGSRTIPSQQKSRNTAIQQSKSENVEGFENLNHTQPIYASRFGYKQSGYVPATHLSQSPKQLLLNQQKKLIEQNSNAQYSSIGQVNLQNQQPRSTAFTNNIIVNSQLNQQESTTTSSQQAQQQNPNKSLLASNKDINSNSHSQADHHSSLNNPASQSQGSSSSTVNKLRTSSGIRNKPQNTSSSNGRDKNQSRSQPPSGHQKIEKPSQEVGHSNIQQSKSQNQLTTYRGFIMTIQQQQEYVKMEQEQIDRYIASYHPAKFACKKNGVVSSYSANTHQGIVRNYNEDRVSIILNIIKPKFKQVDDWPRCSFFAVYDGHGGSACADFLRDQLHQLIVRDENFPKNPKIAIENGIAEAEKMFLEWAHQQSRPHEDFVERSGTCAIIVLIVGDICYVANVGDSRAIMSVDGGEKILLLSKDHKPEDPGETKRVEENGGQIYQNKSYVPDPSPDNASGVQMIIGPHRVFPGRLSVSRTLGDIEAKDQRYGGNPMCVISTPDIKCFKIRNNYDFIILGCDGVFEKLDNKQVINSVWQASRCDFDNDNVLRKNVDQSLLKSGGPVSIHQKAGLAVDKILHECVFAKTLDNITAVMIAFENFENVATSDIHSKVDEKTLDNNYKPLMQRKSLEPVLEEFIESEADTPMMFPIVNQKEIAIANFISNGNPTSKHINNEIESPVPNIINQKRKSNTNSNNKQLQANNEAQKNQMNSQLSQNYNTENGMINNQNNGNKNFSQTQPLQQQISYQNQNNLNNQQDQSAQQYNNSQMGQYNPNSQNDQISKQNNSQINTYQNESQNYDSQNGQKKSTSDAKRSNQSRSTLTLAQKKSDTEKLDAKNEKQNENVDPIDSNFLQRKYSNQKQQSNNSPSLKLQEQNFFKQFQTLQPGKGNGSQRIGGILESRPSAGTENFLNNTTSLNELTKKGSSHNVVRIPSSKKDGILSSTNANSNQIKDILPGAYNSNKQNVKEKLNYGQQSTTSGSGGSGRGANKEGTPIRVASGSMRRKIIAQQSHQHFKKQINGTNVSNTFRDGTPKEKNSQVAQVGLATGQNRVKSSRQSDRVSAASGQSNVNQQRSITPKQAQKMYSSINVSKNARVSTNSKIAGDQNSNYQTQNSHQTQFISQSSQNNQYTHSMQNLSQGKWNQNNNNNNNEYLQQGKLSGIGSGQIQSSQNSNYQTQGLGMSSIAGVNGISKSSKVIPKKEWREQNFNTTQGIKTSQGNKSQINLNSNQTQISSNHGFSNVLHPGIPISQSAISVQGGNILSNTQNFNTSSSGLNVKSKFDKSANLVGIGSLAQSLINQGGIQNLNTTLNSTNQIIQSNTNGQSSGAFVDTSNGRYKKKLSGGQIQTQNQTGQAPQVINTSFTNQQQISGQQKQQQLQGQQRADINYMSQSGIQNKQHGGSGNRERNSSQNASQQQQYQKGQTVTQQKQQQLKLSSHSSRNQSTNNGIKNAYNSNNK